MNKKKTTVVITVILLIAGLFTALIHAEDIGKAFLNMIFAQFDREEAAREAKIERGEPFYGRDTCVIWDNMYEIGKYNTEKQLDIVTKELDEHIIGKIHSYKTKKGKHYVLSGEGYVVIGKDGLCRVFVSVPEEEFISGYSIDKDGNKYYHSKKLPENKYVSYLSSYDEFSEDEKKVFEELANPQPALTAKKIRNVLVFGYIVLTAILITIIIIGVIIIRKAKRG